MKKRPLCYMCLMFLIIKSIIIIVNGGQNLSMPAASFFQEWEGKEFYIRGQIYKKQNKSKIQIFYLKNSSIFYNNQWKYNSKILVYDDTFQNIPVGKTVLLKGQISGLQEARNPGNFDQKSYYVKEGICGIVWSEQILKVTGEEKRLQEKLYQIRIEWKRTLMQILGEKQGGVLSAILLSEKSVMDEEIKEIYQKNGISHILAISGLHISFIGLGIYKIFRKLGIAYLISGGLALLVLGGYVIMIGITISVVRAFVMLILKIGADISGRVYDLPTALALSATITIAYQPLYLIDSGFLMSYGAILGVILVLPALKKLFSCKYKRMEEMLSGVAINIMLFPVLLYFYFTFPTYSVFLNLIAVPLVPFILSMGFLGSLCLCLNQTIGTCLIVLAGKMLIILEKVAEVFNRFPGKQIVFGQPRFWQILIYYLILSSVLILVLKCQDAEKIKRARKYICLVFVASITMFYAEHWTESRLQITFVDVGQGDGIFMKSPGGQAYFIDGGSSDVNEVGKYRIEPFLLSQGVGELDYVFLSHADSDHYSGMEEMIQRQDVGVRIKRLVLPENYSSDPTFFRLIELAREYDTEVLVMEAGMQIKDGRLNITCIQPDDTYEKITGNAGSMVLDIDYDDFSMLCTGDVEAEGEERLIKNLTRKEYDVLKVAHHGSKNSTTTEFLKQVTSEIAIISAGKGNRYGHPHEDTIKRLQSMGCRVYSTIGNGAITLWTDGNTFRLEGFH